MKQAQLLVIGAGPYTLPVAALALERGIGTVVLGRPMVVFLKALPASWAGTLARAGNAKWWQRIWRFITNAFVAWLIDAAVLWAWHAPALMDAVLDNEWVHALQHLSFFLAALLFWWAILATDAMPREIHARTKKAHGDQA